MEGSNHKWSTKKQPSYAVMTFIHEGLALLGVNLDEVGDLLALINSLVQLHKI